MMHITLTEADLRAMNPELRQQFLTWYFERDSGAAGVKPSQPPVNRPSPSATPLALAPASQAEGNTKRRVPFPDLLRAGLIQPGNPVVCKVLKRYQRAGADEFMTGAHVEADGAVLFEGKAYTNPSSLAVAMVRASGHAEPVKALNGYDYLIVETEQGQLSLAELRRRYEARGAVEIAIASLMEARAATGKPITRQEAERIVFGFGDDAASAQEQ